MIAIDQPTPPLPIVEGEVKMVYIGKTCYGIRDAAGYLLLFPKVQNLGDKERYKQELDQQERLAIELLSFLKGHEKKA